MDGRLEILSYYYSLSIEHINNCIQQTQTLHSVSYEEVLNAITEMVEESSYMTLPDEMLEEILIRTAPSAINKLCRTNKRIAKICSNPLFQASYREKWYTDISLLWNKEWLNSATDAIHYHGMNLFYSNKVRAHISGYILHSTGPDWKFAFTYQDLLADGQVILYFSTQCDTPLTKDESEFTITVRFGDKLTSAFLEIQDTNDSESFDYENINEPPPIKRWMDVLIKYKLGPLFGKSKSVIRDEFMKFFIDLKMRSRFMEIVKMECSSADVHHQ